ncbi:MAG TPA: hypothetical protein VFX85_12395 [Solirubrobacterales bacterium]|nr:hypothetical protein [Solirubrobacterales bacterium]
MVYLIGLVTAVISVDTGDDGWLSALWVVASVLLGAGTNDFRFALLSLLAIPIAIPFGLPADTYSDPVLPVWTMAPAIAMFSAGLVVIAVLVRRFVESRWRRRRSLPAGQAPSS